MDRAQAVEAAKPKEGTPLQALKKRSEAAWGIRDRWQKVLLDVYDYVAPHRLSTRWYQKTPANRTDRIFDPAATVSLHRVAGKLQQAIFPAGEPFFMLDPGPAAAQAGEIEKTRRDLQTLSECIHPVFWNGDFDNAANGMIVDAE